MSYEPEPVKVYHKMERNEGSFVLELPEGEIVMVSYLEDLFTSVTIYKNRLSNPVVMVQLNEDNL